MNIWDAVDRKMMDIAEEVRQRGKVKASELVWDYGIALETLMKKAKDFKLRVVRETYMKGLYETFRYVVVVADEEG